MKYNVCIGVDGYVSIEVNANNIEEAKEKARYVVTDMDFGELTDIDWHTANVEDENGNLEIY